MRWPAFVMLVAFATACGGEDEAATPDAEVNVVDAGVATDAMVADAVADAAADAHLTSDMGLADPPAPPSDFVVELGLGARAFDDVQTGDVAPLQRGCQGAQHVWISLRSPDLDPGDFANTLRAVRVRDGEEVVPSHTLDLLWEPSESGAELIGVTLVFFDPVAVVGELVDLHAEVETPDGRVGRTVIRVMVEWGPDAC